MLLRKEQGRCRVKYMDIAGAEGWDAAEDGGKNMDAPQREQGHAPRGGAQHHHLAAERPLRSIQHPSAFPCTVTPTALR